MPRIVDHAQRRAELGRATWEVIRERGLAGLTIRSLSERSGWSAGAIRHYLPNRAAILEFAAEQVSERALAAVRAVPPGGPCERLTATLEALMPLDEPSREWMEVWLAFAAEAVTSGDFAPTQGLLYRDLQAQLRAAFRELAAGGRLRTDPDAAAAEVQALLDGLSLHLLLRQLTPGEARAALRGALDRLLRP